MNDEQSLMEEKSILACVARVIGHNPTASTNYGLSSFSKAEIPAYEWLSDDLRSKIIQSCEHVPTRQGYPVVDWLKQIRSNCDFCETGTMSQTTINVTTNSNINYNNFYLNSSFDSDNTRDVGVDVDDKSSNYDEEINIQECELNPKGNPENELVGTSPCTRVGEEHNKENDINITSEEVGFSCCLDDVADSDSENVDNSSYMSEFMPDGQFPDTSSHSWSFSELTMYPRRVVCCVDLIRDESGYFTSCQTSSFEDLPEPKLVMEHDDTDALIVCQKFLNETTSVDRSRNDSSGSMSTIPGSCDIGSYEASYHFVEENTDLHTSGSNTTSEPIVMNCENNLSLSNVNIKVNVTFPSDADAAAAGNVRWTQTFNNFDSHDSRNSKSINNNNNVIYDYDCKFVSNEQLYKSCDNLDTDNTRLSKIEDSIGSGSSYLQELSREVDEEVEECTSFDDKYSQTVIYENWNTCLTSECSSQSLDDTRTSEFYSPIEFNETAFDEAAGINNFCDYDDDDDDNYSGVDKFRQRKGSTSSDILMWKKNLLLFNMDDEDDMRQWFSSNDDEGKIYFFEENSNESSWVLPTVTASKSQSNEPAHKEEKPIEEDSNATNEFSQPENSLAGTPYINQNSSNNDAVSVSGSKKPGPSDWPQLSFDGNMIILKEGSISRTKITENGKKLRKNWNTSYAVLTELFLLFFKDSKTFNTMMKSGQSPIAKPDISVDLNGAIIEPGERASSRKNVYIISTVLGLQVLIQSDNTALAAEWFQEIHGAIRKLPFSFKSQAKPFAGPPEVRKISNSKLSADQSEESKKSSKVARSRSMKTVKRLDDSLEDLSGTVAERQTKIKAKLRRFFQRRPPVESLVKNGIYKNEPAFGSYLKDVCPTEHPRVPLFVKTCIEVLESNEDNMKTDGLYRASGNLSQIQKIRLQVDQYNLSVLSQEEDVHVLTGALKLFFRELKEPLIPSSFFKEALNASMLKKTSTKIQCFRDIVKALPPANYDTLQFLLKHLLKVTSYQEFNRMHIPNLAIVFGPTLMWPAEESANMALDLMQQNLVIECLLSEYNKIFK